MTLDAAALAAVYGHAEEGYPEEVCGWLTDATAVRCENELHAKTAYRFSARDTIRLDASFSSADPARVVYHSHVDAPACFSADDVRGATAEGRPLWPVDWLVVEVRNGVARDARRYRWADGRFTELAASIAPAATIFVGCASKRRTEP